ncbi:type II toxin-antitoxin system RelE/ParE family toxin, partial [Halochromatium sp.]|uniref:type II toxin-antitoxin system RelE/ParE family toxin n=1 Tax=Halochromatium sp. TaxID=2049430 RepID=UPI00397D01EF
MTRQYSAMLPYADIRHKLHTMIRSFADRETARLWARERVKRFESVERAARKALRRLNAAVQLNDLRNPPGNRLESLQGNRAG